MIEKQSKGRKIETQHKRKKRKVGKLKVGSERKSAKGRSYKQIIDAQGLQIKGGRGGITKSLFKILFWSWRGMSKFF
jgi:hypothetical protein